ncbi:MAG: twin-arginine translocase subunit TatB [Rhizobiales bacterium]|nr:twin-arginine translocase subunit TatB [Hyphomicrobiales bacterium]
MFDIGWSELVIIGVVALIVIGPKELPGVLRMAGQWIGKVRRMASDFQGQFQEAMREAEMADLKKQVDEITDTTRDLTSQFDPIGSMRDEFDDPFGDKTKVTDAGAVNPQADSGEAVLPAPAEPIAEPAADPASATAAPPVDEPPADAAAPPQKAAAGGHSA